MALSQAPLEEAASKNKWRIIISANQHPWLNYPQVCDGVIWSQMQIFACFSWSSSACCLHVNYWSTRQARNNNCGYGSACWVKFLQVKAHKRYLQNRLYFSILTENSGAGCTCLSSQILVFWAHKRQTSKSQFHLVKWLFFSYVLQTVNNAYLLTVLKIWT